MPPLALGLGVKMPLVNQSLDALKLDLDFAPALDRTFIADDSGNLILPSRKGSDFYYSRASGATFVDSDGLIKFSPENLQPYSESLTSWVNTGCTTEAAGVGPNGYFARRVTADSSGSAYTRRSFADLVVGEVYYYGCYVKGETASEFSLVYTDQGVASVVLNIRLSDGQVLSASGSLRSYNVEDAGDGWWRVIAAYGPVSNATGTDFVSFRHVNHDAGDSFIISEPFTTRDPQARFIPTYTSNPKYGPRFEFDPVTGESLGLLIEPERTNYILTSDFSDDWNISNCASSSETLGPLQNSIKITPNADTSNKVLSPSTNITFTDGAWTISVFAKYNGIGYIFLQDNTAGGARRSFFDLQKGEVYSANAAHTALMRPLGNGWYRCSITFTAVSGSFFSSIGLSADGSSINPTGDGTSSIYLAGAQWEEGSGATSYIPTYGATDTREPDLVGASDNIPAGELTVVQQTTPQYILSASWYLLHANGASTGSSLNFVRYQSGSVRLAEQTDSTTVDVQRPLPLNPLQPNRYAVAISDVGNYTVFREGGSVYADTPSTMSESPFIDSIRFDGGYTGSDLDGLGSGTNLQPQALGRVSFYRKRLAEEKLIQLTSGITGKVDADAASFISTISAVGANVKPYQRNAINTFFTTGKAQGWLSSIKRLYLPIWAAMGPNAVDMITRASGTFTATGVDHSNVGYVQSDGSTGYFNSNTKINSVASATDCSVGVLNYTANSSPNMTNIGCGSFTAHAIRVGSQNSGLLLQAVWLGATALLSAVSTNGILIGTRLSGVTYISKYSSSNSHQASNANALTGTFEDLDVAIMANRGGYINGFSNAKTGAAFIADGLDQATRDVFANALKDLWETTSGLTLP